MKVDLPQPDGPMSAVTVPAAKSRETFSSARWLPNQAWTPRASRPEPSGALPGSRTRAAATPASELG
jgi:hypothetical protein